MPIDFAAVAARFEEPLAGQTAPISRLFTLLGRTAQTWARQVRSAAQAVAAVPLLRFDGDAVTVRLVPLGPTAAADPTLGFGAGGVAFLAGMAGVATQVRQEQLVPGALGVAAEVAARLEGRTARVLTFDPSLFTADDASFLDLPAVAAAGARVLGDAGLLPTGRTRPAPASRAGGTGAPPPPPPTVPLLIDEMVGVVTGVVVALPVVVAGAAAYTRLLMAGERLNLLDHLIEAERSLRSFRVSVLEELLDAAEMATIVEGWLTPFVTLISIDLFVVAELVPEATAAVLEQVGALVATINTVSAVLVPILDLVIDLWEGLRSWNLLVGVPGLSFTIGDAIDAGTLASARSQAAAAGQALALLAMNPLLSLRDRRIFGQLGVMLSILAGHSIGTINVPPPPARITAAPDVATLLFLSPDLEAALTGFVRRAGADVGATVHGALAETGAMADGLDRAVRTAVTDAGGGVAGLDQATAAATGAAQRAFGADLEAERAAAARVAAEQAPFLALMSVGLQVAGGLMPHYLAGLQRFLSRRAVRATPVSPHVLARHGRLVAVRTDRLTVRVPGEGLDNGDPTLAADTVRRGLGDVYTQGRRKLDQAVAGLGSGTAR